MKSSKRIQSLYYQSNSNDYDAMHLNEKDEHYLALHYMSAIIKFHNYRKILDVGAGTGRVANFLKHNHPGLEVISIEPISHLREVAYSKGLTTGELFHGDVYSLDFPEDTFDLVCAFGVFHHLDKPNAALLEMKRVSRSSIFISDSNNFGHGNIVMKTMKQLLNDMKLWELVSFIKTFGKMYMVSESDGLFYSFSVFSLIKEFDQNFDIYILGNSTSKRNPYRSASHAVIHAKKNSF